jgi:hypothetical protein
MNPIGIDAGGSINCSSSHVGRAAGPQNDRTIDPAPSLSIRGPENEVQSSAAEHRGGLRPSIPRATSTAVSNLSTASARNRHHGQNVPTSPVSAQSPALVINLRPALSSVPVILSDTNTDQPTIVPEGQHTIHSATQEPTGSDTPHPSVSLVTSLTIIHNIKTIRPSPSQVGPCTPAVNVGATDHNQDDIAVLAEESSTSSLIIG